MGLTAVVCTLAQAEWDKIQAKSLWMVRKMRLAPQTSGQTQGEPEGGHVNVPGPFERV